MQKSSERSALTVLNEAYAIAVVISRHPDLGSAWLEKFTSLICDAEDTIYKTED